MARRRYSREAVQRAIKRGAIAPYACVLCGYRFWTKDEERAHDAAMTIRNGWRICPPTTKVAN